MKRIIFRALSIVLILAICLSSTVLAEDPICSRCGKTITGVELKQSQIALALDLDICTDCWFQMLYGNDTTPIARVAQLGEDGKVLPEQLPEGQGGGDMYRATYDPDEDGDIAEAQLQLSYATHSNSLDHNHTNKTVLDNIQESFTTALKSSYDWLVTNITAVWKTSVDNHLISTSNPHSVTKAQVGLTNVTDDAQIAKSIVDAKGDLISATADNTPARLASSGVNNQVLMIDTSTATGLKWATPAGGGESESAIVLGSPVANATVNLANATGLTFTADANSTYIIETFLVWDSSATTVGIKVSATASGSPTIQSGQFITNAANGTPDSSSWNTNDVVVTTSASAFTNDNMGKVDAVLVTSGSSSTWQLRFAAETTGTITLQVGSTLRYRKVA